MFNIYLETCGNVVICNDYFFLKETYNLVLENKKLRDLIESIEDVKFVDNKNIISKFNREIVGINKLSTSCKTILNVITHPELIFNSDECGINLLDNLFKVSEGSVFMRSMRYPVCNVENNFSLHLGDREVLFSNTDEIREWFRNEE